MFMTPPSVLVHVVLLYYSFLCSSGENLGWKVEWGFRTEEMTKQVIEVWKGITPKKGRDESRLLTPRLE